MSTSSGRTAGPAEADGARNLRRGAKVVAGRDARGFLRDAGRPDLGGALAEPGCGTTSQIVSIHVDSRERQVHTTGPGLKVMPQFLTNDAIGYLAKAGPKQGLAYTRGTGLVAGDMRSPAWSADGKYVVYERVGFRPRPQNLLLYSWDPNHEYRYTDVFPSFSKDGKLLLTRKDGDSSLDIMDPDGANRQEVFPSKGGTAFSPSWSPDGQWIVFGYGGFLQLRNRQPAKIMMVRRDGTNITTLTEGTPNAGFPSWSSDGTHRLPSVGRRRAGIAHPQSFGSLRHEA